uniref:pyruvate kinase n=1 Tax=Glycine max TaxID=3847 RepID=K7KP97_SOYBN
MTKIVDTLGPKSRSVEVTSACLKARMPGFSKCMGNVYLCPYNLCMHALLLVRFLVRDRKEVECCLLYCCCLCQVMMDTFGAKMHADGQVVLTPNWGKEASSQILPINLDGLAMSMTKGDTIFIGHYLFTGSETTSDVICTIENLTTLAGSLFTLHASQIHVDLPTLSDKDNEGVKHKIDYLSLSYTRHAEDNLVIDLPPKKVSMTTRVVDSMTDNLRPTRAEATNVANAILDGSDAILLGAETLCGLYPVETISTIGKICAEVEKVFNQDLYFKKTVKYVGEPMIHLESIASSEVRAAIKVNE